MSIGIFSGNDTRMAGWNRNLRTKKVLLSMISSSVFGTMVINPKIFQVISYISDHKSWQICYILLNIIFLCPTVIFLGRHQ